MRNEKWKIFADLEQMFTVGEFLVFNFFCAFIHVVAKLLMV